jgi:hypothetical protein
VLLSGNVSEVCVLILLIWKHFPLFMRSSSPCYHSRLWRVKKPVFILLKTSAPPEVCQSQMLRRRTVSERIDYLFIFQSYLFHFPKMLTARATSSPMTVREISASIIMSVFATLVNGYVSVGLSAVAAVKATNS